MRVIFFGTPEIAFFCLKRIIESKKEIAAVVTVPDKPQGRGLRLIESEVKKAAKEFSLPILQPESLKDETFITALKNYDADVFVVVAFRILPKIVYEIPKLGSINLHGSLLPKYRGAAPIQWALINGEKETGVTTFFLKEKVDEGDIILQRKIEICDDDDFGSLYEKMKIIGSEVLIETLDLIEQGAVVPTKQNETEVSLAPKITKEICKIDWNKSAENIRNLIRGLSPYPGAFFIKNDKMYKVFKAKVVEEPKLKIGEFMQTKKDLFVGCCDKSLQILSIQPENKKIMSSEEFVRGYII